jgi:hypothetical protein
MELAGEGQKIMVPGLVAAAHLLVLLLRPMATLLEWLIDDREPHKLAQQIIQPPTVAEQGRAQQRTEGWQRQPAFAPVKKRQEERKDDVGVARDFNYECGAVRNRVNDRMSSARGGRSEKGGRDTDHLTSQFLTVIQKRDIENISRMDGAAVGRNE